MIWNLKSRAKSVSYLAATHFLRLYLTRSPVKAGKARLLDFWHRYIGWRGGNITFVATSNHGIRFRLNMADVVSSYIFLTGMWESGITELMVALLKEGDTFIDVGANIGYHSLLAAKLVGPKGRVVSIEPSLLTRKVFAQNLALNPGLERYGNVSLVPYCASDRAGTVTLSTLRNGNSGETTVRKLGRDALTIEVEAHTLDEMLAGIDLSRCPLVKMDIEGAEYLAITGMEATLHSCPSISLILEIDDRFLRELGHSAENLIGWFSERHYHSYIIVAPRANLTGDPLELRPIQQAPTVPENVLFTRQPERFARWIRPA